MASPPKLWSTSHSYLFRKSTSNVFARRIRTCVFRLFELLSQRVHDIQNHLTMIGRQAAKERVAAFLLLLAERLSSDGALVNVPMNRQDIADYLSLTMETVSRTISRLKATRIISVPNLHQLELRNSDALHILADGIA
jgi:CRP-like cAMP-binding protein